VILLAAVSQQPDVSAFFAGFELSLGIAFTVIVGLIGLSILRRMVNT
jgi:hypothetical protein